MSIFRVNPYKVVLIGEFGQEAEQELRRSLSFAAKLCKRPVVAVSSDSRERAYYEVSESGDVIVHPSEGYLWKIADVAGTPTSVDMVCTCDITLATKTTVSGLYPNARYVVFV